MRARILIKVSLLAVVFLIFAFWFSRHQKNTNPPVDSIKNSQPTAQQDVGISPQQEIPPSTSSSETEFLHQLKVETARVGETNKDPAATERELERWANSLSESQLKSLKKNILNPSIDADERSLSVYLLSLNQSPLALQPLQEIALTPLPETVNDRSLLFEEVIRVQALEGLLRQRNMVEVRQTIQSLSEKTNSNFLLDQARRSLAYLNGEAAHPAEQSHKALQNLLNKTRSQQ